MRLVRTTKVLDGTSRPTDDDLEAVSVADAARRLGISRSKLYELIGANEIPTMTIGRRRLVPLSALRHWIEQHTSWSGN
jgi:excisionase family DNA binding protein